MALWRIALVSIKWIVREVEREIAWVMSISLENAIQNWLLSLTAYGWTEQRNLPSWYTQLEYITLNNTYIDSGIIPTTFDYEIETKYSFTTLTSWPNCARGFMSTSNGNMPRWLLATYSSGYLLNANTTAAISSADTNVHVFKWVVYDDNGTVKWSSHIDWEQKQDYALDYLDYWSNNTLSIYIGWRNNNGTAWNLGNGNLYYHKVTKAGVVIQHLIPCKRNSDNEVGLYDLVTNTFFENDWNGTITAWPNAAPTPEMPMDIVSNNGVLKYSANICNVNAQTALLGYYISTSGVVTADANNWIYQDYIPVNPNTTYTLTMSSSVYFVTISEYSTANDSGFIRRNAGVAGDNTTLTIITGSNTNFIRFGANLYRGEVTLNAVLAINWMLNKGNSMPYTPYIPTGIYTDGTVETINAHGKNWFDEVYPNTTGSLKYKAIYIGDGTFTCSYSVPHQSNNVSLIYFLPGNVSTGASNGVNQVDAEYPRTVTAVNGYVTIAYRNGNSIGLSGKIPENYNCMIEKGSTATEYEPYFNGGTATAEMLLKVGDYVDEQEILSWDVTRNIGIKVLDGTEDWTRTAVRALLILTDSVIGSGDWAPYLTHYQGFVGTAGISNMPDNSCKINTNTNQLLIKDETHNTDIDTWKQYLADQYNAWTPVIILYPLATPTTETVTGQTLNIQAWNNTIEITQASIDTLELSAKYKALPN